MSRLLLAVGTDTLPCPLPSGDSLVMASLQSASRGGGAATTMVAGSGAALSSGMASRSGGLGSSNYELGGRLAKGERDGVVRLFSC